MCILWHLANHLKSTYRVAGDDEIAVLIDWQQDAKQMPCCESEFALFFAI